MTAITAVPGARAAALALLTLLPLPLRAGLVPLPRLSKPLLSG